MSKPKKTARERWNELRNGVAPPPSDSPIMAELRKNAVRWAKHMIMQQFGQLVFEWVEAEPGRKVEIVHEPGGTGIHFYKDGEPTDGPIK